MSDEGKTRIRVRVMHTSYGCETGCCGHIVEVELEGGNWEQIGRFEFAHADTDADAMSFAIELARERLWTELGKRHCEDLCWDECEVLSYDRC